MSFQNNLNNFKNNGVDWLPFSYGTGNRHSIQLSYGRMVLG